jgi:hypothetical protein
MQYLLGQARPEDVPLLEEKLVTNSEFFEELLIAEDELIDQYLSHELSESEREQFKNHFLSTPERQRKLRFGQAFSTYADSVEPVREQDAVGQEAIDGIRDVPEPPPKPWYSRFLPVQNPLLAYSLTAAVVLIAGSLSWVGWNYLRTNPGRSLAVTLVPGGLSRSGDEGIKTISVASDVGTLQVQLLLSSDDYPSYRVTLRDDRAEIWHVDQLKVKNEGGSKSVTAEIPARLLTSGNYQIKLAGQPPNGELETVDSYQFRIVR